MYPRLSRYFLAYLTKFRQVNNKQQEADITQAVVVELVKVLITEIEVWQL